MRKLIFILFFSSLISFSQEIVNKNGFPILPQAGDWSIGTDASSFISFFGNIFSGDYNPVNISFHDGAFIYVKKMIEDDHAHRYKMGAFFNSVSEELEFGIGYGSEKRKGKYEAFHYNSTNLLLYIVHHVYILKLHFLFLS